MKKHIFFLTNRPVKVYLFCLFTAAVLITLFSRSSLLYPFNNWADTNIYMTIGREMLHGAVPYRDLFDHKGVLWYLLYMAANLVSTKTFLGLYLIEIFSFSIFLFYSWKLLDMFCPSFYAAAVLPFLGCLAAVSDAFGMGGSAEEIHLSLAAAGLYYLIRFIHNTDSKPASCGCSHKMRDSSPVISYPVLFLNGIFAGCVLWSKYSLLGFWFIWMASVFFLLVFRREWKRSLISCAAFLLGMAAVSIPCLLYLLATGSLSDFWNTYIVINLRYAGGTEHQSLTGLLQNSLHYFLMMFGWNKILGTLAITGLAAVTAFPVYSRSFAKRLALPLLFLCAVGVEYMGNVSHFYYFMVVAPFLVLFFLAVGVLFPRATSQAAAFMQIFSDCREGGISRSRAARQFLQAAACLCLLAASCIYGWHRSPNVPYMKYGREELTQYQAAAIIDQQEHPTLMYYHNLLDIGILMASEHARPWGKYYFMPNISYEAWPEIHDAQEEGIQNREADFVFTYQYGTESLRRNYHLVRYFPASEKDHGDSYLLMQANPYDLYAEYRLAFRDDGGFSCEAGEISWTDQGDENAWVLVGTLKQPVLAEHVTAIAPDGRTPDIYLYVSEDGKNWISEDVRTEFDELSLSFEAQNIRYIKILAARNQAMDGLWQLMVYGPAGTGGQPDGGEP